MQQYTTAHPITSYCCYKKVKLSANLNLENIDHNEIYNRLVKSLPDSALAIHKKKRHADNLESEDLSFLENPPPKALCAISLHSEKSMILEELCGYPVPWSVAGNFIGKKLLF